MTRTLDKAAITAAKADKGALIEALTIAGANIRKENSFCCPFHDDTTPSASIYEDAGVWRFQCHGQCGINKDVWDVRAHNAGRDLKEVLPMTDSDTNAAKKPAEPAATWPTLDAMADAMARSVGGTPDENYIFTDANGKPVMVEMRIKIPGDKTCRSGRPIGNRWAGTLPEGLRPLYNLPAVIKSSAIVIVEGPRKVELLRTLGIVATSSGNGFQSTKHFDWSPLSGKRVVLWRDNDEPGLTYERDVRKHLAALPNPPEVGWVDPSALAVAMPHKGDVVDFCELIGGDIATQAKAVREVLKAAAPAGPARLLAESLEAQIAGKSALVVFPEMRALSRASRALLPGSVCILAGHPGATKSFLTLQWLAGLHSSGLSVAGLFLEESRSFHLQRALAQVEGNGELTKPEWAAANPEALRAALHRHHDHIDSLGRALTCRGDVTLPGAAEWVARQAQAGVRVIAVDPITMADAGQRETWTADAAFMRTAKQAIEASGSSLILVTHPRKGRFIGAPTINVLACSAAYVRAAQSILWLEMVEDGEAITTSTGPGAFARINRRVRILKSRNGPGTGGAVGLHFDAGALRFTEAGLVVSAKPEAKPGNRKHHAATAVSATEDAWLDAPTRAARGRA